ncbi:MAG: RDD family protein [Flammeovirgaceae bacterium]|jgi:uncharacterized RDD family membrane protein YckC|nr:RDD family protein [Flammeovirgaceae bacterium]
MNTNYAGFWLRFVAVIIDGIIIGVVQSFLIVPILATAGFSFASGIQSGEMSEAEAIGMIATVMATMGTTILISYTIGILYFTFMESSKFQATVGKLALGLIVTDLNGGKLDFTKALVRSLCKIISSMILYIGYIMAGFTDKKQGLHDIIAGTLVVKK